jgi:hypothetical protein
VLVVVLVDEVVIVLVVDVEVVVVVVSQPLHVLAHLIKNERQRPTANKSWHLINGNIFFLL